MENKVEHEPGSSNGVKDFRSGRTHIENASHHPTPVSLYDITGNNEAENETVRDNRHIIPQEIV